MASADMSLTIVIKGPDATAGSTLKRASKMGTQEPNTAAKVMAQNREEDTMPAR